MGCPSPNRPHYGNPSTRPGGGTAGVLGKSPQENPVPHAPGGEARFGGVPDPSDLQPPKCGHRRGTTGGCKPEGLDYSKSGLKPGRGPHSHTRLPRPRGYRGMGGTRVGIGAPNRGEEKEGLGFT